MLGAGVCLGEMEDAERIGLGNVRKVLSEMAGLKESFAGTRIIIYSG